MLRGDDGAGVAAALCVGGVDCGTTPENYISKLRVNPPETLILIDAVEMNAPPGTVKIFNFDELSGIVLTSHGVPLKAILEPLCERTKIYLIGIQPKQTELGEGLSPEVAAAVEGIEDYITQIRHPRSSALL